MYIRCLHKCTSAESRSQKLLQNKQRHHQANKTDSPANTKRVRASCDNGGRGHARAHRHNGSRRVQSVSCSNHTLAHSLLVREVTSGSKRRHSQIVVGRREATCCPGGVSDECVCVRVDERQFSTQIRYTLKEYSQPMYFAHKLHNCNSPRCCCLPQSHSKWLFDHLRPELGRVA